MLSLHEVSFAYSAKGDTILEGISHSFTPGKMTALTGPSGRGKSTLLYLMGLMLRPTHGHVELHGENVSSFSDAKRSYLRASQIGFVFQDSALDPTRPVIDSVIEPVLYAGMGLKQARRRGLDLLTKLGLDHRATHRPGEVSGGQAQRVAVCRALATNPMVILADEPTGNLDRENALGVLNALAQSAHEEEARTIVIATHDPFVIDFADEVFTL